MIREVFHAMGTAVDVTAAAHRDLEEARQVFETVEDACSRFRPGSELSRINEDSNRIVPVSPLMTQVLGVAEHARTITSGLVDVGIGEAVRAWGYDRSFEQIGDRPDAEPPVRLPETEWSIRDATLVRTPGTRLDLGGIAKGWACDRAVEDGHAAVVSAGGDVRSATVGTRVEIVDPWGDVAAEIQLGIGALATSSVSRRRWRFGSAEAHHLIDPRTMRPSEGPILQATAITATTVEAEAAAKAIVLLGGDGLAWADHQPWIRSAIAVWSDGCVYATTGLDMAA